MDEKSLRRMQLDCLYDMFRDRVEENVIYIIFSENEGKIDATIDQLVSIASCAFTGYYFEQKCLQDNSLLNNHREQKRPTNITTSDCCNSSYLANNSSPDVCNRSSANGKVNSSASSKLDDNSNKKSGVTNSQEINGIKDVNEDYIEDDGDDVHEQSNDESIEDLQKSIDDLLAERNACHDKACQYLSKKMFPVTSYYSELASQIRRTIEKKTRQLVDLLLKKSQNSNSIDLHGLNPIQARLVVGELLNIRQEELLIDKQGEASFDIITGWGKHCITNGQRIKPAIVSLLREKGYEYHYLNKGALRVTVRR